MDKIGPYRIEDGPFQGGFGEVFRVFDTESGDEFALKTLKNAFLSSSRRVERFRQEIALWMRIPVHPNVVRAVRAFDHQDRPHVLIEWVSGGSLAQRLEARGCASAAGYAPARAVNALELLRQVCAGIGHIHQQGLVHGDVKPSNIMMWSGASPQLTDFGLARVADDGDAGPTGGTTRYMAPELARTGPTRAADIYAAGIVLLDVLGSLAEGEFGVREARELAHAMCSEHTDDRPASFGHAQQRLAALIAASPIPPSIGWRAGSRLTWDEQHVAPALPHRDRFNRAMTDLVAGRRLEAKVQLESIVSENPAMFDARIELASILIEDGDRDAAAVLAKAAGSAEK